MCGWKTVLHEVWSHGCEPSRRAPIASQPTPRKLEAVRPVSTVIGRGFPNSGIGRYFVQR